MEDEVFGCLRSVSVLYELPRSTLVGRDVTRCQLALESPSVSKQHAALEFRGQRCFLIDRGSRNGTFVNGTRLHNAEMQLHHGDLIRFGYDITRFRFECAGPAPPPASPRIAQPSRYHESGKGDESESISLATTVQGMATVVPLVPSRQLPSQMYEQSTQSNSHQSERHSERLKHRQQQQELRKLTSERRHARPKSEKRPSRPVAAKQNSKPASSITSDRIRRMNFELAHLKSSMAKQTQSSSFEQWLRQLSLLLRLTLPSLHATHEQSDARQVLLKAAFDQLSQLRRPPHHVLSEATNSLVDEFESLARSWFKAAAALPSSQSPSLSKKQSSTDDVVKNDSTYHEDTRTTKQTDSEVDALREFCAELSQQRDAARDELEQHKLSLAELWSTDGDTRAELQRERLLVHAMRDQIAAAERVQNQLIQEFAKLETQMSKPNTAPSVSLTEAVRRFVESALQAEQQQAQSRSNEEKLRKQLALSKAACEQAQREARSVHEATVKQRRGFLKELRLRDDACAKLAREVAKLAVANGDESEETSAVENSSDSSGRKQAAQFLVQMLSKSQTELRQAIVARDVERERAETAERAAQLAKADAERQTQSRTSEIASAVTEAVAEAQSTNRDGQQLLLRAESRNSELRQKLDDLRKRNQELHRICVDERRIDEHKIAQFLSAKLRQVQQQLVAAQNEIDSLRLRNKALSMRERLQQQPQREDVADSGVGEKRPSIPHVSEAVSLEKTALAQTVDETSYASSSLFAE
ncbi:MAG: hypothetical protein MHM6MM_003556 [Cercozoa sp. M6MM]